MTEKFNWILVIKLIIYQAALFGNKTFQIGNSEINRSFNFRFSPCIIIVNYFYYPTNVLNYYVRSVRPTESRPYRKQHRFKIMLPNTDQAHDKISVNHSSVLPHNGSYKIRNMSE